MNITELKQQLFFSKYNLELPPETDWFLHIWDVGQKSSNNRELPPALDSKHDLVACKNW